MAVRRGVPGEEFVHFGRRIGWRLLTRGELASGVQYILTPVISVRLFEFEFALNVLPEGVRDCLDISSPRLFSLFVGGCRPDARIAIWNPDAVDYCETEQIVSKLGIDSIHVDQRAVDGLAHTVGAYDCIWSLSVIEHISGAYDDRCAVKQMYDALRVGGRLILTFPVDRQAWDQDAPADYYGTQPELAGGKRFFFQRFYDLDAIEDRILASIGARPTVVRWFGEVAPGRYDAYQQRLARLGYDARMDDVRMIAEDFQLFDSFESMPGMGVCGIAIDKFPSDHVNGSSIETETGGQR